MSTEMNSFFTNIYLSVDGVNSSGRVSYVSPNIRRQILGHSYQGGLPWRSG